MPCARAGRRGDGGGGGGAAVWSAARATASTHRAFPRPRACGPRFPPGTPAQELSCCQVSAAFSESCCMMPEADAIFFWIEWERKMEVASFTVR
eukprot:445347-Rhodomonas_salina.3